MSLAGCQINPIDGNFHLQKSLEIFDHDAGLTLIGMRQGTFHPLSFLDQIFCS